MLDKFTSLSLSKYLRFAINVDIFLLKLKFREAELRLGLLMLCVPLVALGLRDYIGQNQMCTKHIL